MPLHAPRSTAPLREGDILAGKYRIERIIGTGAMGVVVSARHLKLDERVAIKFLLPETLGNREAVARFEREGRAAVKIKSEHVVRVIDVGNLENGAPYMVMEHLEGGDLAAWLRERGPLSCESAVEFVLQALEAVAEAHAMGIVHRDLKPSNLFCVRRNDGRWCVKVLDFGISKIGTGTALDLGMTRTSDVMGSPLYMSPEQMESARDVDATTDVWAVGITLFQLITGRTPFAASTMPELVLRIANGAPERLRAARPEAPAGLERVILRCLEKDRSKRYRDAGELAAALVEFGAPLVRTSADRTARAMQGSAPPASSRLAPAPPPSRRPSPPAPRQAAEQTIDSWGKTTPMRRVGPRALVGLALAATAVPVVLVARLLVLGESEASQTTVLSAPPDPEGSTAAEPAPAAESAEMVDLSAAAGPRARADPAPAADPNGGAMEPVRAQAGRAPAANVQTRSTPSALARPASPPALRMSSPRPAGAARRSPSREAGAPASPTTPQPNTVYDERK